MSIQNEHFFIILFIFTFCHYYILTKEKEALAETTTIDSTFVNLFTRKFL